MNIEEGGRERKVEHRGTEVQRYRGEGMGLFKNLCHQLFLILIINGLKNFDTDF
jgi:hypothetical protein